MKMIDAIESFYLSPSTRNEGIQEVFVNSTQILDELEKNQTQLYEGLKKNKPIIEKILKGVNPSFPVDQFIGAAQKTIKQTVSFYQFTKPTENPQLQKLFQHPKLWLNAFIGGTVLDSLIPDSWRPMSPQAWDRLTLSNRPSHCRFPDKETLTKDSSLLQTN